MLFVLPVSRRVNSLSHHVRLLIHPSITVDARSVTSPAENEEKFFSGAIFWSWLIVQFCSLDLAPATAPYCECPVLNRRRFTGFRECDTSGWQENERELKCADTIGTVLVPFPGLKYKYIPNKTYESNFIKQHSETVIMIYYASRPSPPRTPSLLSAFQASPVPAP